MKGESSRCWKRGEPSSPSANAELRFILYKYDAMPQNHFRGIKGGQRREKDSRVRGVVFAELDDAISPV